MLVLSRREGEKIIVRLPDGRHLRVILVKTSFHKTRIGFEAPLDIKIWREELGDNNEEVAK